jgi:hypothetical protein
VHQNKNTILQKIKKKLKEKNSNLDIKELKLKLKGKY